MSTVQERWDNTFSKLDRSCPPRRADENEPDFLRRLSRIGKKYLPKSEDITGVRFDHTLPDAVVPRYSELVREAVERNIMRTDNMEPGSMRSVMTLDENSGQRVRNWVGPTSFVRNPLYGHRDCRLVTRINMPATTALYSNKAFASGGW
jgi:hypothetical protein